MCLKLDSPTHCPTPSSRKRYDHYIAHSLIEFPIFGLRMVMGECLWSILKLEISLDLEVQNSLNIRLSNLQNEIKIKRSIPADLEKQNWDYVHKYCENSSSSRGE